MTKEQADFFREPSLIFTGPEVLAARAGRKTQDRALVRPQPQPDFLARGVVGVVSQWPLQDGFRWFMADGMSELAKCPYRPGDRVWVRETWKAGQNPPTERRAYYKADKHIDIKGWPWRSPVTMPRWAARLILPITEVRCQRLQDISEEDARAEGCEPWAFNSEQPMTSGELGARNPYRGGFACSWDERHDGNRNTTWFGNPWVWALAFGVEVMG